MGDKNKLPTQKKCVKDLRALLGRKIVADDVEEGLKLLSNIALHQAALLKTKESIDRQRAALSNMALQLQDKLSRVSSSEGNNREEAA